MPIKNDFELLVTTNRLMEFKAAREEVSSKWKEGSLLATIVLSAIDSMIEDLESQISYFVSVPKEG